MSTNAEIGLSRKQRVFAVLEDVFGTLQMAVGTTDFIRPAGNAQINQNPVFSDSEELENTLDVLDRFQGALPPAKWSIPMYLRPAGTLGGAPQGACLFQSLQGSSNATTTAKVATAVASATAGTVIIGTIAGGLFPEVGVIRILDADGGYEDIRYTGIDRASRDSTTATLTGCTRDWGGAGTALGTFTATNVVTLRSKFYDQDTVSPSLSIWVETDHLVQGLKGASVSECSFEMSNDGGVKITLSGEGMEMVWAGTTTCSAASATAATGGSVTDAGLFSVGAPVYATAQAESVATISAIDLTTNRLTFVSALASNWASDDTICGYLPAGTVIGDVVESKDSIVRISGVTTKIKTGSISVRAPKKYLADEIGTDYPEDFLEDQREITSSLKLYFKKAAVGYFSDAMANEEYPIHVQFGDTAGYIMDLFFPRASIEMPTVEANAPALELTIPMKALGTEGEDSLEIVFC